MAKDKPSIFGTGLIALDVIIQGQNRRPRIAAGGTCGNVLAILGGFGWEAYAIASLDSGWASRSVCTDLERWGVKLDYIGCPPLQPAPIIVETIGEGGDHKFSYACPYCDRRYNLGWPLLVPEAARDLLESIKTWPDVFFFDYASAATVLLAEAFAEHGALIVFEPSTMAPLEFRRAVAVSDIVKYSRQRLSQLAERNIKSLLQVESRLDRLSAAGMKTADILAGLLEYAAQNSPAGPHLPLLEIETIGQEGLRYRSKIFDGEWTHRSALGLRKVKDTAGAGDWCTAGILLKLWNKLKTTSFATLDEIIRAIDHGQALAAMACGYEGPRGMMTAPWSADGPRDTWKRLRSIDWRSAPKKTDWLHPIEVEWVIPREIANEWSHNGPMLCRSLADICPECGREPWALE